MAVSQFEGGIRLLRSKLCMARPKAVYGFCNVAAWTTEFVAQSNSSQDKWLTSSLAATSHKLIKNTRWHQRSKEAKI
jgi:hypothetical protein